MGVGILHYSPHGGIEIEEHKSFAIWRFGTEYGFALGN